MVKDEIEIVNNIITNGPKIAPVSMLECSGIPGSQNTAPTLSKLENPNTICEVTKEDMKSISTKRKVNQKEINDIRQEMNFTQNLLGNGAGKRITPIQENVGDETVDNENFNLNGMDFGDKIDLFFDTFNSITNELDDVVSQSGRVGQRLKEHWELLGKRLKKLEPYADRVITKIGG